MLELRSHVGGNSSPPARDAHLTIIVVAEGGAGTAARTVRAISTARRSLPSEVLVLDPQGPIKSLGAAVAAARGRYLLLVRSGTIVTPGAMRALITFLEREDFVAAAVPKVVDRKWRVVEAGQSVHEGGTLEALGAQLSADDSSVDFMRRIDASRFMALVRGDLLREFFRADARSQNLTTSLVAFTGWARERGMDAVYRPDAVVLFAGAEAEASAHREQAHTLVQFPFRETRAKILVMDELVPRTDRDAGSKRLVSLIGMMRSLGHDVVFVPHQPGSQLPASRWLREMGCDVRTHDGDVSPILRAVGPDVAWISRPEMAERYMSLVRACVSAPVIYDTVDLHHVRLRREESVLGRDTGWQRMQAMELRLMRSADRVVVTSFYEHRLLKDQGIDSTVIPVVADVLPTIAPFASRNSLLFVGNFTHAPNIDALQALSEMLPRLDERLPGVRLAIAGFDPDGIARRFAGAAIRAHGHVRSLEPYYEAARVFVAPLRFGAGAKGKIIESLAHGLPVVTTAVGAEGLGIASEEGLLVADDSEEFMEAVTRAYVDADIWTRLSERGRAAAATFSAGAVRPVLSALLDSVTRAGASA